jgi:hypothetical protein
MKQIKMSLSVCRGSKVKKASNINQIFSLAGSHPSSFFRLEVLSIRFGGVGNSANKMISVSRYRSIRFRRAGCSANQAFSGWGSTNLVSRGWEFSQSGNFDVPVSSNHVFLEPEDQAIRWKDSTL